MHGSKQKRSVSHERGLPKHRAQTNVTFPPLARGPNGRLVVEDQYHDIVSASDAWAIAEEGEEEIIARDVKATNSARRIRALVDQVTGPSSIVLFQLGNSALSFEHRPVLTAAFFE